ncbi:hypothetical protein DFH11DRAFT_1732977 [Phellopilus nigrolimitatus]|nr:hypothetical protein DFH11DRAFT_1732977 [Phellopilus nigrolimitatus]
MATDSITATDAAHTAREDLRSVLADAGKEEDVDVLVEYVGAARTLLKTVDDAIQARRSALNLKERVEAVREKNALKKAVDALVARVEREGGDLGVLSAVDALVGADLVPVKVEAEADTLGPDRASSVAESTTMTGARKRAASSEHADGARAGLKSAGVEEDTAGTADAEGEDDPAAHGAQAGTPPPVSHDPAPSGPAAAGAVEGTGGVGKAGGAEAAADAEAAAEAERVADAERAADAEQAADAEATTEAERAAEAEATTEAKRAEEAEGTTESVAEVTEAVRAAAEVETAAADRPRSRSTGLLTGRAARWAVEVPTLQQALKAEKTSRPTTVEEPTQEVRAHPCARCALAPAPCLEPAGPGSVCARCRHEKKACVPATEGDIATGQAKAAARADAGGAGKTKRAPRPRTVKKSAPVVVDSDGEDEPRAGPSTRARSASCGDVRAARFVPLVDREDIGVARWALRQMMESDDKAEEALLLQLAAIRQRREGEATLLAFLGGEAPETSGKGKGKSAE